MRTLLVTNLYPTPGDATRGVFTKRQFDALHRLGQVTVTPVIVGKTGAGGLLASRAAVRDALYRERPDVVHVYYGLSGASLPPRLSVPVVLTLCGSDLLWWTHVRRIRPLVERAISLYTAWRAARVIVQSQVMLEAIPFASIRARTTVLRTGVDAELFRPRPREEARARLGWPRHGSIVLFPANPARAVKRFDLAQGAVATASVLTGLPIDLRTLTGVAPDEVPWHMNGADCVLITSRWEAGPVVLTEALACGVPVVTVRVGYVASEISTLGLRIAGADPSSLGSALASVLLDPPSHSRSSHALAETEDQYAAALSGLYEQVVGAARFSRAQ